MVSTFAYIQSCRYLIATGYLFFDVSYVFWGNTTRRLNRRILSQEITTSVMLYLYKGRIVCKIVYCGYICSGADQCPLFKADDAVLWWLRGGENVKCSNNLRSLLPVVSTFTSNTRHITSKDFNNANINQPRILVIWRNFSYFGRGEILPCRYFPENYNINRLKWIAHH